SCARGSRDTGAGAVRLACGSRRASHEPLGSRILCDARAGWLSMVHAGAAGAFVLLGGSPRRGVPDGHHKERRKGSASHSSALAASAFPPCDCLCGGILAPPKIRQLAGRRSHALSCCRKPAGHQPVLISTRPIRPWAYVVGWHLRTFG